MRMSLSLSAALTFTCLVSAQATTPEGLEIMPGRASTAASSGITYVIRVGGNPSPAFEALQMYDAKYWQGIGDMEGANPSRSKNSNSDCEIDTINVLYQDQDISTSESFELVARGEASKGSRTADTTATLWTQTVPGFPAGTGGASFLVTVQIMTAPPNPTASAIPIPCTATFFFGMELPAAPNNLIWPADGLAIAVSEYSKPANYTIHDWPKGGNSAAYLYQLVLATGGGRFAQKMSFGYNLIPDAAILQAGARDPCTTQ